MKNDEIQTKRDELHEFMVELSRRQRLQNIGSFHMDLKITQQLLSLNAGKPYKFEPAKLSEENVAFKQVSLQLGNKKVDVSKVQNQRSAKKIPLRSIGTTLIGATCFSVVGYFLFNHLLPIFSSVQANIVTVLYVIFAMVVFWKA